MRERAFVRLRRQGLDGVVDLDPRPYGSHADFEGSLDGILLSYSLSMIPPFEAVLERARRDLRPGGRVAVVDFLDAWGPVDFGLRRSHVHLGPARLDGLKRRFPHHRVDVRGVGLWSYFVFVGSSSRQS
jgi:S-adenosylmethionine-diacylgycerolhomoserine-N-methlytransferase